MRSCRHNPWGDRCGQRRTEAYALGGWNDLERWLLLTRGHNLSRPKKTRLKEALSLGRRLFKAYYLKEQIDHLDGLVAHCEHKIVFGTVEAINDNLRSVIRRGRGCP